jgi:hypothetical protein
MVLTCAKADELKTNVARIAAMLFFICAPPQTQ